MTIPTFPTLIGFMDPWNRSPTWKTIKQEAISGKEYRVQLWTYPRYKYEIGVDYLGSGAAGQNQDWQTFMGFFNSVAGAGLPFHWSDPVDNSVTTQAMGTGNGTQTQFNFVRSLGGFTEPVQDVQTITGIYLNGTATSSYGVLTDPNWGLTYGVQFSAAPSNGVTITWTGTYDWACRFDEDNADLSHLMHQFWEMKKITFESMKVL
jgi:uncharacterized protein (TIGR02217 family)